MHELLQILKSKKPVRAYHNYQVGTLNCMISYNFNNDVLLPRRELGNNFYFLLLLTYVPLISRTMASFVRITPSKVHGIHK